MFSLQLFIDQCKLVGVALETFLDACYFDPTFHRISFHNMFEMCFFLSDRWFSPFLLQSSSNYSASFLQIVISYLVMNTVKAQTVYLIILCFIFTSLTQQINLEMFDTKKNMLDTLKPSIADATARRNPSEQYQSCQPFCQKTTF